MRSATACNRYIAYGLSFCSQLPLPELLTQDAEMQGESDVNITVQRVESNVTALERRVQVTPTTAELTYPQVGTFVVREGKEILITTSPSVSDQALRLTLLGPVLSVILHQRGLLVLHASAIAIHGKAIAFLGGSGWGKSTTAATFHRQGYPVLADDLVAVQTHTAIPTVFPGFPRLKLCSDVATHLGDNLQTLDPLLPELDKQGHCVRDQFSLMPMPLSHIYVLAGGEDYSIQTYSPQEQFKELVRHSFLLSILNQTNTIAMHFEQCCHLSTVASVFKLIRPNMLRELTPLTKMIEEHLNPSS